jgi:hypothetical protein
LERNHDHLAQRSPLSQEISQQKAIISPEAISVKGLDGMRGKAAEQIQSERW